MTSILSRCWCPNNSNPHEGSCATRFFQMTCLRHSFSLRRQLVAGFGITAFMTVFLAVVMASMAAQHAGSTVKTESRNLFIEQLDAILQESGTLTGDILEKKVNDLRGSVNLLVEIVRDRIVGYPNDGWENDIHVPFIDQVTGERKYPLKADLLPRDFEIKPNINISDPDSLAENLQERGSEDLLIPYWSIHNTETSMFNFQGNCDPNVTSPDEVGYYQFCTDENNDASLGGKINPTDTLAPLEQKAADIGIFLKAIFESQPSALSVGVYFANSGAGAGVRFPAFVAPNDEEHYSSGCMWMNETNPLTGRPYGTKDEINRCTPAGTRSPIREYNAMEREWCADQALHPGETRIFGPYEGATGLPWRMTFGKAVFDRMTNEFIGCTFLDMSKVQAERLLAGIGKDMRTKIVVTLTDGTVVVGANQTDANGTITNPIPFLGNTDFIDNSTYAMLTEDLAFWESEWDIESAQKTYNRTVEENGKYYYVVPSPLPPDEYDPLYRPDFLIFGSLDDEIEAETILEIEEQINNDVKVVIITSVSLGAIALLSMMTIVSFVAQLLTKPLEWMENKSWEIVNHSSDIVGESLRVTSEVKEPNRFFSFLPKTEVQELVSEFRSMISGFSGEGASTVAVPRQSETKNVITWKEDFRKFYDLSPNLEDKLKEEMNMMTRSVSRRMSKNPSLRNSFRRSITRRNSVQRRSLRAPMLNGSKHRRSFSGRSFSNRSNSDFEQLSGFEKVSDFEKPSLGVTNSDFDRIVSAAEKFDEEEEERVLAEGSNHFLRDDIETSQPFFQCTQMTGESTTESPARTADVAAVYRDNSSYMSSATVTLGTRSLQAQDSDKFVVPSSTRINLGSNTKRTQSMHILSLGEETAKDDASIRGSPLFWNILCWIVIPLLAFIAAIMIIVGINLMNRFPIWIEKAMDASGELEIQHLIASTDMITKHMEQIFEEPLKDLHMIHRTAGWLLFDAIDISDGIADIEMDFLEECKMYKDPLKECPYVVSDTRSPCPCEWNDPWGRTCMNSTVTSLANDPRYVQKLFYMTQRKNTSEGFPSSPQETSWYSDPNQLQGAEIGSNATGYSTAYARSRVTSALSTIMLPVYNYGTEVRADGTISSGFDGYISFEADGAYGGYAGCNYDHVSYSHFVSNDANGAYKITDNCPNGTYGYDPRCRGWYDEAKREGLEKSEGVYVTPPYKWANIDNIGTTAVAPLIDPKSGEFVGNTLLDLLPTEISKVVDKSKINHYIVITPSGQAVISSEIDGQSGSDSIIGLLAPNDTLPGTETYDDITKIIEDMQNEGYDSGFFNRTKNQKTGELELFAYQYEPIYSRELRPVQADDYSRGAVHTTDFQYSIIMYQEADEIVSSYYQISNEIDEKSRATFIVYVVLSSLATFICVGVFAALSFHVTTPMIQLLRTVKQVNAGRIGDNMPPLTGGSREVHRVYASFAKLYKIVRMSNSAFFVGDLTSAHRIGLDALNLFRKIGDQKAIAIACNNMGNTLLAFMVEYREPGSSLELNSDGCTYCTEAAMKYLNEAVLFGTRAFEDATGDADKAKFAQQLADRHFNRAMCLLLTADDPCADRNAKETALDDLHLVKQYDQGVKEYMLHSKTLLENSDIIFERTIRRLHGLAALIDICPDVWEVMDIYELVDQADLMLQAAWNQSTAPLFHNMTKIGRLQELEGAVTGIELASGQTNDAVHLATRMMIEDEYLLDSSFIEAADCILQCYREELDEKEEKEEEEEKEKTFHEASMTELKHQFKMMRKPEMRNSLDIGRAFVFCFDLKGEWNGQPVLRHIRKCVVDFYKENFQPNDMVGIVTFNPNDGSLKKVKPSSGKDLVSSEDENFPHRDALVAATTGVACSRFTPALQGGIDMAIELESSVASDVCLLYVSDGGAYEESMFGNIHAHVEATSRAGTASMRASCRHMTPPCTFDLVVIDLGAESRQDIADLVSDRMSVRSGISRVSLNSNKGNRPSVSLKRGMSIKKMRSRRDLTNTSLSFEESCKNLVTATRSRGSIYLEADIDNLEEAFQEATAAINDGTSFEGNRLQRALTMQKF